MSEAQRAVLRPINPATGHEGEPVPCSTEAEVGEAIERATRAQRAWGKTSFEERAAALRRFAARLTDELVAEELARLMSEEMGKPIRHARAEVRSLPPRMEGFIARAEAAAQDEVGVEYGLEVTVQWRPVGVVAVIAPWNYPVSTPNNLVVSALLTGNTVVLKPSELTPRTGARYHELLAAELPEGVFEVVQGAGEVGRALVAGDVQLVAFTGSVATGQRIMREAAEGMKRLVLEMGGKDPMVVLPGADLDLAARHAVLESTRNSGQVCVSVERVFVHQDVAAPFVEAVKQHLDKLRLGDPGEDDVDLGPMASEHQRKLVLDQLADARRHGAKIEVEGETRGPGFWLAPSVVVGVEEEMALAREETFGPVVAISTYGAVDEAVERANHTEFGLGASVWGPEGELLDHVVEHLEAGMVGVNRGLSAAAGAPWVGWKKSGFGYTRSVAGMRQFMQPRSITRKARAAAAD